MNLQLSIDKALEYTSNSQKARILTEDWISRNIFCPVCGNPVLTKYENNKPVADFFCTNCASDFELKSKESKKGDLGNKIVDGAYSTMISRITSLQNPNFFFLTYSSTMVNNVLLIPRYFFVPEIIEKRKPLSQDARRAGWTGCNINIESIPQSGKIFLVKNSKEIDRKTILEHYKKTESLQTNNLESRGWIMDVLSCIERIPAADFSLDQVYVFADELQQKHPDNNFVKDKIRQQLQYLRDKGFLEFTTRGHYKRIM